MTEYKPTETDMRMSMRNRGYTEAQVSELLGDIKAAAWEEGIQVALGNAEDTTDRLGNLYRLDWLDRMKHDMERNPYRRGNA